MRWLVALVTVGSALACVGTGGSGDDEGTLVNGCTDSIDNDGDGSFDCDDSSCSGSPMCEESDADADSDSDSDADADPVVSYDWDRDGLAVTIDNYDGGFDLGIGETGASSMDYGWFGEDCFNGTAGYDICHAFSGPDGVLLSLGDGANPGDPDDVVSGETTLFNEDLAFNGDGSDRLTYMITLDDGSCLVWGDDTSYYSAFSCSDLD